MLGAPLLKGLAVTARNFVQSYYDPERLTTVEYPEVKTKVEENFRSFPFLVFDATADNLRCVACKICEQECPPQCIYIEIDRDPKTGKPLRRPKVFDIDYSVCMQCQICVEMCPFDAIKMDQEYELSRPNRFDGLLFDKTALLKSNEHYHKIHPQEADDVDKRLSAKAKKPAAKPAAAAPKPAAPAAAPAAKPAAPQLAIPADAPFSSEQRAWLEGFLKGAVADGGSAPAGTAPAAPVAAPAEAPAPAADGDMPWHDSSLGMEDRMKMAEGQPLAMKLMASMAQLDCNACGYDCKGYADAIVSGQEKDLTLCVPGEKETADKVQEILKQAGKI